LVIRDAAEDGGWSMEEGGGGGPGVWMTSRGQESSLESLMEEVLEGSVRMTLRGGMAVRIKTGEL